MAWNNVFLRNKFILYGLGISNQKVEQFFIENSIDYLIVLDDYDLNEDYVIIKSPGIPNNTYFLKKCIKKNLLIINDIELFYLLRPKIKYIGITGTCGKTTTCTLLYNIMKEKFKVELCGNIGIPIFTYINEEVEYLIVELSSYQLEYINNFRPNYYIILNVYSHHLNHHLNYENYLNAKLKPIHNLKEEDYLIINKSLYNNISNHEIKSKVFTFSSAIISDLFTNNQYLSYKFNKENFSSIYVLLNLLNFSNDIILTELEKFTNLPYRMEQLVNNGKLVVINDSKSTCFNSLIAAIDYCRDVFKSYSLTIIIGGKIDLEEIRENILSIKSLNQYFVYCYGENRFLINKIIDCKIYNTLEEVINDLEVINQQVILFSPAAQSLDQFKSFEERGLIFKNLIFKKLNL